MQNVALHYRVPSRKGNACEIWVFWAYLHIVEVLIRLFVNGEVSFGDGRVVAYLTSVRFVSAGVGLPTTQSWVRRLGETVDTVACAVRGARRRIQKHPYTEGILVHIALVFSLIRIKSERLTSMRIGTRIALWGLYKPSLNASYCAK